MRNTLRNILFALAPLVLFGGLFLLLWLRWGRTAPAQEAPPTPGLSVSARPMITPSIVPWDRRDPVKLAKLRELVKLLEPLHTPKGPVQPGDWLAYHEEPGQTFEQYIRSKPVRVGLKRNILYILPIGQFSPAEQLVVEKTVEYMSIFFGLPVRVMERVELAEIPPEARRQNWSWGSEQLLTRYILDKVLRPRLPDDAVCALALTAVDLWPGDGWNYVFGEASLKGRVGVWSIYRNGNPGLDEENFRTVLLRTIKTATHETGHMFSIEHCTAWECNMCGCNNTAEADRNPTWLCHECFAKLICATHADPLKMMADLEAFYTREGLTAEADMARRTSAELAGWKRE